MKKIPLSVSLFVFLLSINTYSQTTHPRLFFISVHTGGYFITNENFSRTYDSNNGLVYGLGFGVTLSNKIYLYSKVTYFSKDGIPVTILYNIDSTGQTSTTMTKEGTAKYKEWIINAGAQYNLTLSDELLLCMNGGFTYIKVNEFQSDKINGNIVNLDASGLWGLFLGVELEKQFGESPLSAFLECQYNFSLFEILGYSKGYGGTNVSMGIRFYFKR